MAFFRRAGSAGSTADRDVRRYNAVPSGPMLYIVFPCPHSSALIPLLSKPTLLRDAATGSLVLTHMRYAGPTGSRLGLRLNCGQSNSRNRRRFSIRDTADYQSALQFTIRLLIPDPYSRCLVDTGW